MELDSLPKPASLQEKKRSHKRKKVPIDLTRASLVGAGTGYRVRPRGEKREKERLS